MSSTPRPLLLGTLLSAALAMAGCTNYLDRSWVYKVDVQQGNVITQEMVNQLRPGMTKNQVRYALGSPMLVDVFHQERWDYLYRQQPGGGGVTQNRISLHFEDGLLSRLEGDYRPLPPAAEGEAAVAEEVEVTVPEGAGRPREKGFIRGLWDDLFGNGQPQRVEVVVEGEASGEAATNPEGRPEGQQEDRPAEKGGD